MIAEPETNGFSRMTVAAAIVFGCATLAAIILMTWIVATDAARRDERAWQHDQIQELLQRTAKMYSESVWQHGELQAKDSELTELKVELEVLKRECAKE